MERDNRLIAETEPQDGDAEAQDRLSGPAVSSDSMPANVSSLADRKRRRTRVAGVLVIAAVAVTAGVLAATNLGSVNSVPAAATSDSAVAPTASATSTATPAPSLAPSPSGSVPPAAAPVPPAEEWQTFTSAGGKITFDYPAEWRVAAPTGAAGSPAVDVDVSNADGTIVASLHYGPSGGIGGACQGAVPYTVLDSVELALPYNTSAADTIMPRFVFRALQERDRVTASYGITSSAAGKDGTSCMFYNVVSGPAESPLYSFADAFQVNAGGPEASGNRKGAKTFRSLEEVGAYMQAPEYLNAKRMITSLKINAG